MADLGLLIIFGLGGVAIVVTTVAYVISNYRLRKRTRAELFDGRRSMTSKEYYDAYFLGSAISVDVVAPVVETLSTETDLDFSRLLPDERWEMAGTLVDGLDLHGATLVLEEKFGILFTDEEMKSVHTTRDLIELVDAKRKELPLPLTYLGSV